MSFFQNARNVGINGGTFLAVNGDYNNFSVGRGLQALSQAISHGAMHDSSERDPYPRCHPDTRKKVVDDIVHWLEDATASTSVLWVNGRAGVGKSALMQTIAELLSANELGFGGSFFFQRTRCDVKGYLFSTLAYQLAINVAGMREYINQAMEDNPALPTKSAAIQLQQLIVEPFMHLPTPRPSPVIIIDGLDECDDSDAQRDILSLISQVSTNPEITIRFIIASRPEYQITHMFNKEPLLKMTRRLVLDEDYESLSDIMVYLRDGFATILEGSDMVCTQIPWPSDWQLKELAWRASGQFIYAATVLKFIGSDFCDPEERLNIILYPNPMQAGAFSELDCLYTQILSAYPDPRLMKSVLGIMIVFERELMSAVPGTYPSFVADILGARENKVCSALRALQSLTFVEGAATAPGIASNVRLFQPVEFSHKSFVDFLIDERRSTDHFVDFDAFQCQALCRAFVLVIEAVRSPMEQTTAVQVSTWKQLEHIFQCNLSSSTAIKWLRPSTRTALHRNFTELRLALSDSPLYLKGKPSPHVFPALHFACNALNILRIHPRLPEVHDTMDKLFLDTRNFLDICYRQCLGADANSLIGHLALDFSRTSFLPNKSTLMMTPRPVKNICKLWNVSDPLNVETFLHENSHLFSSEFYPPNLEDYHGDKTVSYSACHHLHQFVINPSRAQHLYQHFWILRIRKCQEAISKVIESVDPSGVPEEEFFRQDFRFALGIREYFEQNRGISGSSASILDLRGSEDLAPRMALLDFLDFLCRVPWAEVFLATEASTMVTLVVASWICHCMDSPSGILTEATRSATESVCQAILTNGILPKFCQQIVFMEQLLNNDEATLSLILDWTAALQERAGLWAPASQEGADAYNGVHLQVPDKFDGQKMHLLFKDIARELLYTVTQNENENSSLGTINLEKLLFQRLKTLLLPAAGFPMHYWGMVYACMLSSPPPKDGSCLLTWDALLFLCFDLPPTVPSPFLQQ